MNTWKGILASIVIGFFFAVSPTAAQQRPCETEQPYIEITGCAQFGDKILLFYTILPNTDFGISEVRYGAAMSPWNGDTWGPPVLFVSPIKGGRIQTTLTFYKALAEEGLNSLFYYLNQLILQE